MLLFRSEEHVDAWCAARDLSRGALLTLDQAHLLARAWYEEKLQPGWKRLSPEATAALFTSLGLTGPFWAV
jgi:Alkylmercury lyase